MIFAPVSVATNCQWKSALYGLPQRGNRKSSKFKRQKTQTWKSTPESVWLNYGIPPIKRLYTPDFLILNITASVCWCAHVRSHQNLLEQSKLGAHKGGVTKARFMLALLFFFYYDFSPQSARWLQTSWQTCTAPHQISQARAMHSQDVDCTDFPSG